VTNKMLINKENKENLIKEYRRTNMMRNDYFRKLASVQREIIYMINDKCIKKQNMWRVCKKCSAWIV